MNERSLKMDPMGSIASLETGQIVRVTFRTPTDEVSYDAIVRRIDHREELVYVEYQSSEFGIITQPVSPDEIDIPR